MEIKLDVNNFMLDLERCKNKEEMRTVFEKYYPNKEERERMWSLMEKYRNNEEKVLNKDTKTMNDINDTIEDIVDARTQKDNNDQ
ncbi:hypothetical protein CM15mP37_12790 [bacterium]|nr:MAG: hypothetical protein CM15mP37_12790 [bacterium]|tara:strand:- start:560 stop:814 length:255 start_codon:yes stop_codon:yes gene_type:complete